MVLDLACMPEKTVSVADLYEMLGAKLSERIVIGLKEVQ